MAAKRISSLSVVLGAITSPFEKGFHAAGSAVSGLHSKLGSLTESAVKWTGIGAAIGALLGGVGIGALVHQQLEAIDSNAKLADRIGTTTEALAGLQHAGDLSGVSAETLTGGLEKMLKSLSGAAEDGSSTAAVFERLGLNAKDLANLPTDQAFGKIADALNAIQNPAQKAQATMAIFGKAGQQLLPLLSEGSEGIAKMTAEAEALGLSFNRVDARKVEQANDAVTRVRSAIVGVGRVVAIAIAPYLQRAADLFTRWGISTVSVVKTYLPVAIGYAQQVFGFLEGIVSSVWQGIYNFLAPIVSGIVGFIAANWQTMVETTVGYYMAVYNVITSVGSAIWSALSAVGSALVAAWNWAMGMIGAESLQTGGTVGGAFQTIVGWCKWLADKVTLAMNVVAWSFKNLPLVADLVATTMAYNVVKMGNQIFYVFHDVIPAVVRWFADDWQNIIGDVFNWSNTIFANLVTNVVTIFKNLPGLIKGSVNFSDLWTPLTEGFQRASKELVIPDRVAGNMENALADATAGLQDQVANGLGKYLAEQEAKTKDVTKGITEGIKSVVDTLTNPPPVQVPPPQMPPPAKFEFDTDAVDKGLKGVEKSAKSTSDAVKLVVANSAEAMQLHAQGAFANSLIPKAAAANPSLAVASTGGLTRVAPNHRAVMDVVNDNADNANSYTNKLLKQLIDTVKSKDEVELSEAA